MSYAVTAPIVLPAAVAFFFTSWVGGRAGWWVGGWVDGWMGMVLLAGWPAGWLAGWLAGLHPCE